ncbi:GAF domain-containing protein [Coraliomargarita akajimensis]|uniref:Putative GAF sensor protein n=1 Tax=Coraliomargarita akajimensis (strain DSM 45221 / IAM 15411 / JCM 23193 / KCTC 12865 / 04OKA010-24) TaxID=583355 RepID=D5EJA4_CORAD|nr:GAF domain-containing protein [Coraliomargarita akajimensis]ADE54503.1 putative GAF sensor protein [Coraliomargarita akajimensis DSM 45221]
MFPKSLSDYCHHLLADGLKQVHMPIGIVSHIYNNNYEIVAIEANRCLLRDGALFPLNDTYCRDVYRSGETIALTEIDGVPGLQRHPLYVKMPLEAYLSAPIHHHGFVWGTVNFTSNDFRNRPFSRKEIQLCESYATLIQHKLCDLDTPLGFEKAS